MIEVTVKNGSNRATKQYEDGTTVDTILSDSGLMSFLGAGENSTALINSAPVVGSTVLQAGNVVYLERQAASKA